MKEIKCWLCKVVVTEENNSGVRKDGDYNPACSDCNHLYTLVHRFRRLTFEALVDKTLSYERRIKIIELIMQYPTATPAFIAKEFMKWDHQ